jgi:hypothetical protein
VTSGMMRGMVARCSVACGIMVTLFACRSAPRAAPITGVAPEAAVALPRLELSAGTRRIRFNWQFADGSMAARGNGVARVAAPDTARVDLFLGGAFGNRGASAIVIGDTLMTPPGAGMTEVIPSAPLLWATLGRLAIPALPDTIIRMSSDTLRASIGRPEQWRVTALAGRLLRLERVDAGRLVESVDLGTPSQVRYQSAARRSLVLEIQQDSLVAPFDASVWQY